MSMPFPLPDGDSMATDSEAPSTEFENEDDSMMSESVDLMESGRSARSMMSEYSDSGYGKDSSLNRLVDNLNDVDHQFGDLITSQRDERVSNFSQATLQSNDVRSLQDELNSARLSSPSNSLLVESVDEASALETGIMNASLRRLPSAGPSLGHIQEETVQESYNMGQSVPPPVRQRQSESPIVETVDEASCHEFGVFSSDRRRSADSTLSGAFGGVSDEHYQEEIDPSYFKKRDPTPQAYDGYETSSTTGGFSNSAGMGAPSTEQQWDSLQSTLDQQTEEVRNSPYYNTPPGHEPPNSPGNYGQPNTEALRRELDGAALQPPTTTNSANTAQRNNKDVEAAGYWQGDKKYDEEYDDELLDVSLSGRGTTGPIHSKNSSSADKPLSKLVGNDSNYQIMVKSLATCICCMIIWTLAMIIILTKK